MNPRSIKTLPPILKSVSLLALTLSLSSCGSNSDTVKVPKVDGFQQSHGPFDENGNYVEHWADSPPKRRFIASKRPSRNVTTPKNSEPEKVIAKAKPKAYTPPKEVYTPPKQTYTPPKQVYTPPKQVYTPPKKTYTAPKQTYTPPKPKVVAKTTPKKPAAKKITPKAKPPIIHRVVKNDTLFGLSRRYNTSVSAIQTANNLKGTSISLGTNLIIPRR